MTKSQTMRSLREFVRADSGATAIEYALIASGIAAAIVAVVTSLGTQLNVMYKSVSTNLN